MNDGIKMFLLLVIAPTIVGIAMILVTRRTSKTWAQITAGSFGVISFFVCVFYLVAMGPYMWALHLESKWRPANPQTMSDLESKLSGYTKNDIQPAQSTWGQDHKLGEGDRMTRYSLMGAPLDVVYSAEDRILAIYTTYE
jgi:hypothetical protein